MADSSVMTAQISNTGKNTRTIPLKPPERSYPAKKKQQGKTAKEAIESKKAKKAWKKPKRIKTTGELLVQGTFSPYVGPIVGFNIPAIVMAIIALVYVCKGGVPCKKSYLWVVYNALFSIMHICAAFYMLHKVGVDKEVQEPNASGGKVAPADGAPSAGGDIETGTYYKLKETKAVRMKKNRGLTRIVNKLSVDPKMFVYAILNVLWLIWQCKGIMLFLQSFENKEENCGKVEFFMILDWAFTGVFLLFLLIVMAFAMTCPRLLEETIQGDPSQDTSSVATQSMDGTLNKDLLQKNTDNVGATSGGNINGTSQSYQPPPPQQSIPQNNMMQQPGGAEPNSFVNSSAVGAMLTASAAASPPKSPQAQQTSRSLFARSKKVANSSAPTDGKGRKKKKKKSKNGKSKTKPSATKNPKQNKPAESTVKKTTSPPTMQTKPPLSPSSPTRKAASKAEMIAAIKRSRSESPSKALRNFQAGSVAENDTDIQQRLQNQRQQLLMQNGDDAGVIGSGERLETAERDQQVLRDGPADSLSTDDDYDIRASSTVTSVDTVNHLYDLCSPQAVQPSWDDSSYDDDSSSGSSYYSDEDEDPEFDRNTTMKSMEFQPLSPTVPTPTVPTEDAGRVHL
mmetsp:Transcript_6042/g.8565  ORF Transcript_6042/g.8565 Transcript_6042/m.8565 type:complete len:624 (+) Transcript_6042:222-2093(+)